MAVAIIQPSFAAGELSPNLYGRVDLAKFHIGASTMRNFFVNYRGGASSRAGTRFVGWSAQSRTGVPPRLIRFQFSLSQGILLEFGEEYIRFILNGDYVTSTAKVITGITQASPGVITSVAHGFQNDDLVFLSDIVGMTELNGNTYTVANATVDTFQLVDMFGNVVNTTTFGAYVSDGTAARIYTVATPYAATDLPALKFTQSADVMTFVHPSFPSYDLIRIDDNHWTFTATNFNPVVSPPTSLVATATTTVDGNVNFINITAVGAGYNALPEVVMVTSTGHGAVLAATIAGGAVVGITVVRAGSGYAGGDTVSITGGGGAGATATADIGTSPVPPTTYSYVVTAIDRHGNESVASAIASASNSVDISAIQGTIQIQWQKLAGRHIYHIYKAPPSFNATTPVGTIFGFIGYTRGHSFTDNNILPDFVTTPPLFQNPFAPGQIINTTVTARGSGYTSEPTATITTATGSGAVLEPVIVNGHMEDLLIINAGHNYLPGDTVTISGGGGTLAAAILVVGPTTGTYPSVVAYFQERRVYANTINQPDTYFMSHPGLFTNFDVPVIPLDDSAIIGTPWAQQVNGIEQMVPMPTGLIVLTGLGAWLVNGSAQDAAITPTSQSATAQAYNGCHDNIPPIQINQDILYVQAKGSIVRDLTYNLWNNVYTGTDISIISDHLFLEHQIQEWAWAEEPHKIVWAVRDDGIMLSLSYLKEQEVQGWARHDTKGLFQSVATVTEQVTTTAVDTLSDIVYVVVLRFVNGEQMYYIERMDPRFWNSVESSWCLDCALALPQLTPDAVLTASQSYFPGKISSIITIVDGGSGYTMPSATIVDPQSKGKGQGAKVAVSLTAGVVTSIVVIDQGKNYVAPQIVISDPTGLGCVAALSLDNRISFTSSAFASWAVGDVIRMGGGQATITAVASGTQCTANLTEEITTVVLNDPLNRPVPAPSGQWTVTTPVTTLSGLNHLEGQEISVLADGSVISDLTVIDGTIELAAPASSIIVGLPFQAQLQSLNTDVPGEATVQGKRKNIYAVTVRVEKSRGLKVGANQPNTAAVGFNEPWENLVEIKERGNSIWAGAPIPLFTGDERVTIPASWRKGGQIAVQQDYPLPANILAFIPEEVIGDSNG